MSRQLTSKSVLPIADSSLLNTNITKNLNFIYLFITKEVCQQIVGRWQGKFGWKRLEAMR
jgi:hypothetical protein